MFAVRPAISRFISLQTCSNRQLLRLQSVFLLCCLLLLGHAGKGWAVDVLQKADSIVPERQLKIEGRQPSWKENWDKARELVRQQDFAGAMEMYNRLLADKPVLEEARWELAQLLLRLDDLQNAAPLLEWLHAEKPDNFEYGAALGALLVREEKFGRARLLLEEILRQQGDTAAVLDSMVVLLQQAGSKEELFEYLQRYLRFVPGDGARRMLLAQTAFEIGQFEQARTFLQPLLAARQAETGALRLAARVHDRLGLTNLARNYWQQLRDRFPNDEEANLFLATFYEGQPGMEQQALAHLLAVEEQGELPPDYDFRVGALYASLQRFRKALSFLQRFHQKNPDHKAALRLLVKTHAALGDRAETLALLEKYFILEENPDPQTLRQAADLYEAAGRLDEAIPLYRTLLDQSPADPELLEVLARDLLVVGEEEGALGMWKLLAEKSPQRLDAHFAMAGLLEKLRRDEELIGVLQQLSAMQPNDIALQVRLAEVYQRISDRSNCARIVSRLYSEQLDDEFLLARRARLGEYLHWCGHALADYLLLLASPSMPGTEKTSLQLAALRCAGKTGRVKVIASLAEELQSSGRPSEQSVAAAYHEAGDLWQAAAIYGRLLEQPDLVGGERRALLTLLAELYREEGLAQEERRMLLLALLEGEKGPVLASLALSAARQNRQEEATGWIERLEPAWQEDGLKVKMVEDPILFSRFHAARILILLHDGKERTAGDLATAFFEESGRHGRGFSPEVKQQLFADLIELADAFRGDGLFNEAEEALSVASILAYQPQLEMSLQIARAAVAHDRGDDEGAENAYYKAVQLAQEDESLLLLLVRDGLRRGEAGLVSELSSTLLASCPGSLSAHLMAIDNLTRQGELEAALRVAEAAMLSFSESVQPRLAAMRLYYRLSRFAQVLDLYEKSEMQKTSRFDLSLLAARSLWSAGQHEKAIAFYRSLLEPDAAAVYRADEEAAGLSARQSGWFSWLPSEKSEPLAERLYPQHFAVDSSQMSIDAEAAGLSSRFAWQHRINHELAAREAVQRFEFYRAGRLYKALLQEEQEPDLPMLFDLAGIYSRLERPSEEAAIYDMLAASDPDFPGLAEAMGQNGLKRRPRAGFFYSFGQEEGRDDKKAIKSHAGGISSWIALPGRQELSLRAERSSYRSTLDDREKEWSKRAEFEYSTSLWQGVNALLGAGLQRLDHASSNFALLKGSLDGELGDSFAWQLSYLRDMTCDTIDSLRADISRETISLGSAFDFLSRLQLGFDYSVDTYNDGNLTEGYDLWTSYLLFTEPTELSIKYSYEFKDSKDSSYPDFLGLGGVESQSEHPYYTPHNYWLNKFGVYFKHSLSAEKFGRGIPRYYELALSLGHDSAGYAVHTAHGALYAQWNSHILIEAATDFTTSEKYRSKEISFSIDYRW